MEQCYERTYCCTQNRKSFRYFINSFKSIWFSEKDEEYLKSMNQIVKNKFYYSQAILEKNYYQYIE